jgi:hypothetical protein
MSDLNDSLKEGYIGQIADALGPYSAELTAKGFDPAARIAELGGAGKLIEDAKKERRKKEAELATAVQAEQDEREKHYDKATATVSLAEGLLGKDHELPVKLRGLRAKLVGNQNPGGTPPAPATH